jgi:5,10-methylenetetrahydromethanopterin reductase
VDNYRDNFGIGFLGGNDLFHTIQMAKRAEEAGFTNCWIAEDYFFGGAFSTATACAMNTSTIEIGIGVINPYTRHPALSAMEVAALDAVSKGRTILGLGASNKRWIEQQMGIPFKNSQIATKETVEIIRALIKDKSVNFNGDYFKTGNIHLEFEPYRSDLPIYLGVKGPKALRTAGRIADGVLTSIMTSLEYIKYVKERLSEGADEVGRELSNFHIGSYLLIYISEDKEKAKSIVKPLISKYLGIHGDHPILTSTGMDPSEISKFKEALLKGEDASDLVTDWMIDTFAIVGTPEECRGKLKAFTDLGVHYPIAFQIPGVPIEETINQICEHILNHKVNSPS